MWPVTFASLKRTGSSTVAVNLSPTRESLLDNVSSTRIFRLVPIGTNGPTGACVVVVVVLRTAARLNRGLVRLCASASKGNTSMVSTTAIETNRFETLDFICEPPRAIEALK
jgi:hypothetical protein